MFKNQNKRENMKIKFFKDKSPSKRSFTDRIHSFQRRTDARGSADIINVFDVYRQFAGQA